MIRVDNGPKFISALPDDWCKQHNKTLVFIQPSKPMQNGYLERCNGSIRREILYGKVQHADKEAEYYDPVDAALQRTANEKYINRAIALDKVLHKYCDSYPGIKPARSLKKIIFNIFGNALLPEQVRNTGRSAKEKAAHILELKKKGNGPYGIDAGQ